MSTFEIKMPKLGESITEGTIMKWTVKPGDQVKDGDTLFEVNTQKVSAEIPSPVDGKVSQLLFKEGETIAVGLVIALIELDAANGEAASETQPEANPKAPVAPVAPPTSAPPAQNATALHPDKPVQAPKSKNTEEARWFSPLVLQLAREAKIPYEVLETIPGTGYLGRVSKKDIESYIEQKQQGRDGQSHAAPEATNTHVIPSAAQTVLASSPAVIPSIDIRQGEDEIREMDPIRRIIADHMVMSKHTSPHVTTIVEVDVTKLVQWRERVKDEFQRQEGVKLTYMPAIMEASAKALTEFPLVNASVDGHKMILKKQINIGVAVALNDGNLIVPVVHQADKKNIKGLGAEIEILAAKARSNKLKPDDIFGGTFTITNFGSFKNIIGTPIINQPQVAILGVGYIEKKPAVIETPQGDTIGIRHKMYLSLSYDHRMVDGALGGMFLKRIADYLEQWDR